MNTTLYRYFDSDGRLLYVGITKNLFQRQDQHSRTQPWWHEVATATFQHLDNRDSALFAETAAIARELPKYNKAGPTISNELALHLSHSAFGQLQDEWHQTIARKMQMTFSQLNEFSQQPESYKLAFAFDAAIEWDSDGEMRIISCDICRQIVDSPWFKFASIEANEIICEEYTL